MADEPMTEREAALTARIKELEGAQTKSAVTAAQGGVFESVWRTVSYVVPPWLAAMALAVFIAHYAFASYLQIQVTAAETQLKQAKADLETAKAEAANARDTEGVSMRLATLQSQTNKTTAEAAVARASANALNAQVNGETAALAAAKANLDNLQNQARLAQAKADAESARFGLSTLEDRAVRAKLIIQKLKAVSQNREALTKDAINRGANPVDGLYWQVLIRAECQDNEFAELIGCPSQFLQRNRQRGATPQEDASQVATAPSDDNGNYWKPAPNCALSLRQFRTYDSATLHGAFAVTKIATNGGCGWSSSTSGKPMEVIRREALAQCASHGADCKIISER
jgi:hypothetical protein